MTGVPATCELIIGGTAIADGAAGDPAAPVALDGLTVHWGRSTTIDQPAPATCSATILDRGGGPVRVDDLVALGATLIVRAVVSGRPPVIVFAGRVTDLDIAWDDAGGGTCEVIAADLLADLASRFVGTEPWAQETLSARASRIVNAVAAGTPVTVDSRPAALPVSRMDVDRQAAANLLTELAVSGTAVLWVMVPVATGKPVVRIEDPSARGAMKALVQQQPPGLLWVIADSSAESTPLDACTLARDPVHWTRATADLMTRVTVRWLDQSTTPNPTERTVLLVNTPAETEFGARGLSVGTILASQAAADAAAQVLMAGHGPSELWRVSGLHWDLAIGAGDTAAVDLAVALLDNEHRTGLPLILSETPGWAPAGAQAGCYLEGGDYTYTGGRWVLSLQGIPPIGLGGSLSYGGTDPSIRWVDIDPAITFADMLGVGRRGNTGPAWADMPAGMSWASVPAGTDWSEDPR